MNRYEALRHAVKAHAGQVDKCGQPYILHPIAVAEALEAAEWVFSADPENAFVVALLHDVWEDTNYALPTWESEPSPTSLTQLQEAVLHRLTRYAAETYAEYIEAICRESPFGIKEIACIVKLADLWHNLQPERQDCLPEGERKGLEKRYLQARDRIWEALGYEWWPGGGEG